MPMSFRCHPATGCPTFSCFTRRAAKRCDLEILGFWRRTDAEKLYRRLARELGGPFILGVSDQFNIDETLDEDWGEHVYRFKRTPIPGEVVRLAERQIKT